MWESSKKNVGGKVRVAAEGAGLKEMAEEVENGYNNLGGRP